MWGNCIIIIICLICLFRVCIVRLIKMYKFCFTFWTGHSYCNTMISFRFFLFEPALQLDLWFPIFSWSCSWWCYLILRMRCYYSIIGQLLFWHRWVDAFDGGSKVPEGIHSREVRFVWYEMYEIILKEIRCICLS